jgi:hypothetical protein
MAKSKLRIIEEPPDHSDVDNVFGMPPLRVSMHSAKLSEMPLYPKPPSAAPSCCVLTDWSTRQRPSAGKTAMVVLMRKSSDPTKWFTNKGLPYHAEPLLELTGVVKDATTPPPVADICAIPFVDQPLLKSSGACATLRPTRTRRQPSRANARGAGAHIAHICSTVLASCGAAPAD